MTEATPRPRGRQREARRNDGNLLAAARLVFALQGPAAPVSAIAEEAGVGIATLYRRYPTKAALVEYLCAESLEQQIAAARAALEAGGGGLAAFISSCVGFRAGVFTSLAGGVDVASELTAKAEQAHALVVQLVAGAQVEGTIRRDVTAVDVHQLIELFSRRRRHAQYERLLTLLLDGLRPGGSPLPTPSPTWDEGYASLWAAST